MKPTIIIFLAVLVLTGGTLASAQSSRVPGATDYAAFSRFVTERNIFDPNRQPHYQSDRTRTYSRPRTRSASAPAFTFVGTMSYEKGLFAFFSGNDADLKKVLPVTEKIAGFTVVDVSQGRVTLESTNKPERLALKVGDVMRLENGKWGLSGSGEEAIGTSTSASPTETNSASGGETPAAAPPPAPAAEPNEILKRLMEKRAKE